MVLGLVSLAATIPLTASAVLSLQDQSERRTDQQSARDPSAWMRNKAHVKTRATERTPGDRKPIFEDSHVVLRNGLLYIQSPTQSPQIPLHPFTGYYLPYPGAGYEGIVSTISENPPQLNWIYVDPSTYRVKHGLRVEAERGVTGPWGARMVDGKRHILWRGWEGFLAVETSEPGLWGLYFDCQDNGMKGMFEEDRRVVEVELLYEELEKDKHS
ncbi:hypothetical protein B0J12DRAFT_771349 [Macrophomina phaseolina]|uniref:Uncharacterized protein n=1 Tax=Macrophomina phaseolina TaxID=35725 RepID=A0ABQ8FU40_9PEZI|nr:hypothetical protein B0J12DRAFT_771349 [Macrophomina phaseolina]